MLLLETVSLQAASLEDKPPRNYIPHALLPLYFVRPPHPPQNSHWKLRDFKYPKFWRTCILTRNLVPPFNRILKNVGIYIFSFKYYTWNNTANLLFRLIQQSSPNKSLQEIIFCSNFLSTFSCIYFTSLHEQRFWGKKIKQGTSRENYCDSNLVSW